MTSPIWSSLIISGWRFIDSSIKFQCMYACRCLEPCNKIEQKVRLYKV